MEIDFTDPQRRKSLDDARKLIVAGYRILRDDVGADNPADNAFLREAHVCAMAGIVWVGDRGGADGKTSQGDEVEIKSTRLDARPSIQFPTSRYVSPTVIRRFRAATFWLFAIFDVYEELIALYRVDAADMQPLIDRLASQMTQRETDGTPYQNNPKLPFSLIRPAARRLYVHPGFRELQDAPNRWTIRPR
jgi:restriction endonuclease PvuII